MSTPITWAAADEASSPSQPGTSAAGPEIRASTEARHRAAGQAFAGELDWLASTVTDVADSWLRLDRALLGRPAGVIAE